MPETRCYITPDGEHRWVEYVPRAMPREPEDLEICRACYQLREALPGVPVEHAEVWDE